MDAQEMKLMFTYKESDLGRQNAGLYNAQHDLLEKVA